MTQSTFTHPSEVLATDSTSMSTENVDRKKRTRDEMEEEFEFYFRDPQSATLDPVDADNDHVNVPRGVAHGIEHAHIADRGEERSPLEAGSDEEDESEDDEALERIFWDSDADREDEEEDEEDNDIGDFNVPNRLGAQPQPQPPQAPVEQLNDGVEDLEAAVEDDMEGALEGMLTIHK